MCVEYQPQEKSNNNKNRIDINWIIDMSWPHHSKHLIMIDEFIQ